MPGNLTASAIDPSAKFLVASNPTEAHLYSLSLENASPKLKRVQHKLPPFLLAHFVNSNQLLVAGFDSVLGVYDVVQHAWVAEWRHHQGSHSVVVPGVQVLCRLTEDAKPCTNCPTGKLRGWPLCGEL